MAAQMLAGRGFDRVYNLSGGFRAWTEKAAYGPADQGLELFSTAETPEKILVLAYGLETGLQDFYQSMADAVHNSEAGEMFRQLGRIEEKHRQRVYDRYLLVTGSAFNREEFEKQVVHQGVEGGLSTREYMQRFRTDPEAVEDILSLAMSIEAQALDLYLRGSEHIAEQEGKDTLKALAAEEQEHLHRLGSFLETIAAGRQ